MPELPDRAARKVAARRAARQAVRRSELVNLLRISECTVRYAAVQLGNGISPAEARETALFTAGELAVVVEALRRAVRLDPAARRRATLGLAWRGLPKRQIATRLGVSERTVHRDLRSRSQPVR